MEDEGEVGGNRFTTSPLLIAVVFSQHAQPFSLFAPVFFKVFSSTERALCVPSSLVDVIF